MVTALTPQINAKSGCISQLLASGGAPCTGRCTWQFARADFMAQNLTLHVAKCQTAHCTWELDTDHGKAADCCFKLFPSLPSAKNRGRGLCSGNGTSQARVSLPLFWQSHCCTLLVQNKTHMLSSPKAAPCQHLRPQRLLLLL